MVIHLESKNLCYHIIPVSKIAHPWETSDLHQAFSLSVSLVAGHPHSLSQAHAFKPARTKPASQGWMTATQATWTMVSRPRETALGHIERWYAAGATLNRNSTWIDKIAIKSYWREEIGCDN